MPTLPSLPCILSFLPLVLGGAIIAWMAVVVLWDTLMDLSSGYFVATDLIGALFMLALAVVLYHLWSTGLGCLP